MDYKYIEQLLERYWACETSVQEESILRNFFAQQDVPEHLLSYKPLFQYQQEMETACISADFDERILALVDDSQSDDRHDTSASVKGNVVKAREIRMGYRLRPFFKAAAVVAVVLSFSMAVQMAMYEDQDKTPNVVTLPPAVVPGAPETADAGSLQMGNASDSLNRVEQIPIELHQTR